MRLKCGENGGIECLQISSYIRDMWNFIFLFSCCRGEHVKFRPHRFDNTVYLRNVSNMYMILSFFFLHLPLHAHHEKHNKLKVVGFLQNVRSQILTRCNNYQ